MVVGPEVAGTDAGIEQVPFRPLHAPERAPAWRPFANAVTVFAAIAFGTAALVWYGHSGGGNELLMRAVLAAFPAILAVCSAATAHLATGRSRSMWRLMALAGLLWTIAEATRTYAHATTPAEAAASLTFADGVGLLAVIPATAMLLGLIPRQARAERRRLLLGALVIGGSVFFLVASLAPHAITRPTAAPPIVSVVWMAFPVAYIGLASLALFVLAGKRYDAGISLKLVATGFLLFALASATGDAAAVPETTAGVIGGNVARLLGFIALMLAPHVPGAPRLFDTRPGETFERPGSPRSLLVFVPLLSMVVVVSGLTASAEDVLLRVTEICTLLLFGLRQALIARDSARLHDQAEARVQELQRTSASLARLAHQNERTIESVSDGIFGVDTRGQVTFANAAAIAMIGCAEREIVGAAPEDCFLAQRVDGYDRPTDDPIEIALSTGRPSGPKTAIFAHRDGSEFPVEWSAGPVDDYQHKNVGAVVVFRDITRRREVERLKDDFVSVVNHELRTPLTSIRGVLGLLDGGVLGQLTERGRSLVGGGVASTERLTRLVNDLLDFDRIESGAATLLIADCEVDELVGTALDGVRQLAATVPVALEIGEAEGQVRADGDRIVQTLTNLLGNAIKFSPPDSTIRVTATPQAGFVEFAVTDEGRGIPSEKLDRIFERFEQVDSSDSRLQGGTGLGLAISRTIVRKHGGEIWAESRPGTGSEFHFTIPAAGAQPAELNHNGLPASQRRRVRDIYRRAPSTPAALAGADSTREPATSSSGR